MSDYRPATAEELDARLAIVSQKLHDSMAAHEATLDKCLELTAEVRMTSDENERLRVLLLRNGNARYKLQEQVEDLTGVCVRRADAINDLAAECDGWKEDYEKLKSELADLHSLYNASIGAPDTVDSLYDRLEDIRGTTKLRAEIAQLHGLDVPPASRNLNAEQLEAAENDFMANLPQILDSQGLPFPKNVTIQQSIVAEDKP